MNEKILIIDDEPYILDVLNTILTTNGYEVDAALGGKEGIELYRTGTFDLVITDIRMPELDGSEVIRQIKQLDEDAAIIILTGFASIEHAIQSLKNDGASDYLTKPLGNIDELIISVHKALERRRLRRENKKIASELREREEKYRLLIETMNDGLAMLDKEMRITFVNNSFCQMLGYSQDELSGYRITDFNDEANQKIFKEQTDKLKKGGQGSYELAFNRKDGKQIFTFISPKPLFDYDGNFNGSFAIFVDITQAKLLQKQLIQSERLAATGKLAASVAHEINSPLQGITAFLYSIEQSHKQDRDLMEDINLIKAGFERIRNTVKNLLDFNRPCMANKQSLDVNRIIKTTASLVQNHLKKQNVKIYLNLSHEIADISGSPQHLGQVFLNLINNAAESITETSRPASDRMEQIPFDGVITLTSHREKDKIIIKVSDTGTGISENDLAYIFDPFYTKKKTMGMGVGLSVCHDIIKDHNGMITAKNSPEGGAVFTITLPAG